MVRGKGVDHSLFKFWIFLETIAGVLGSRKLNVGFARKVQPTRQPKLKEGVVVVFRQIQRAKVSILLWSRFLRHITWMCNAINIQVGVDCFKIFLETYINYFVCRFLGEKDTIRIGSSTAL